MYLQCPRRWKMKYIDNMRFDHKVKHLEYGLAVHETYEKFFADQPEMGELIDYFKKNSEEREIPFDSPVEEMEFMMEAEIAFNALYDPQSDIEKLMVESEIVGIEEDFEYELDGVTILGFIDLIVRDDMGLVCIDHKSGKPIKADKLKTDWQFPIYAMAIKEKYGEYPYAYYYNYPRFHDFKRVTIPESRIELTKEEIKKTFKKMARKSHSAKPTPLCYWCDYGKYHGGQCKASSNWKPKGA